MAIESGKVSLERALSKLGAASRRQTREWILDGRLQVNGRVVKDPMFAVRPETDRFTVDGEPVVREAWIAIMLKKAWIVMRGLVDSIHAKPYDRPGDDHVAGDR